MKEHEIHGQLRNFALDVMQKASLFSALGPADRDIVLSHGRIIEYQPGEVVVKAGEPSDSFFLIVRGKAAVLLPQETGETIEISRLKACDAMGEVGLLLRTPRTASVQAVGRLIVLEFESGGFQLLMERVNGFAIQLSRVLAHRLMETSRRVPLPDADLTPSGVVGPTGEVTQLLPAQFIQRHQVLPLKLEGDLLTLGFVHDPAPNVISTVQRLIPGVQIRPVRVTHSVYNQTLRTLGLDQLEPDSQSTSPLASTTSVSKAEIRLAEIEAAGEKEEVTRKLKPLLTRMVAEGASDVHLAAGQPPRWRIDGEMQIIEDARSLGKTEVYRLLEPALNMRTREVFELHRDVDFTYPVEELARFRVNMFEDENGICAVLRLIPLTTPSMKQLGLPPAVYEFCKLRRGLILVTGNTGCGKSTTLASMIDHINRTRRQHIVTLEDPIEFVHDSQLALINQREIGQHAVTFSRALRAALRQDPDIVLVGEMRDAETVSLALETASTGHLVLGTLHTNSAIGSLDRIIDMFPADERDTARSTLADVLAGVMTQTLCRRKSGGRIAAYEILVSDGATANLIRQNKTHQISSAMTTGRSRGNLAMNDHLAEMVRRGVIEKEEALFHSLDREALGKKLG